MRRGFRIPSFILKQKKVVLKDIALEAGVSTALVSYVLNNRLTNRISKEVADKIRKTAKDLNYQPNQIAKSLKTQKTNTIGLIVADIANPFSAQIARIIEDEAQKHGYTVIIGSSDENLTKSQDLLNTLVNRQVDGLIIAAAEKTGTQIRDLQHKGVPFVLIDRYFPNEKFSYIGIDNFHATYTAVQHLLDNGRKNIGFISFQSEHFHIEERKRGYEAAMTQAGRPIAVEEAPLRNIQEGVEQGVEALLQSNTPVDALLFSTNVLALWGLKYLKNHDIRIPEDLAIVAFDETDFYDLFYVPITYVQQPLNEIGREAVIALLMQMQDKNSIVQKNLETHLVIRASSQ